MSRPITVVFDAYHLYHLPQFDPVFDLLQSDDRFIAYLTTSADTGKEEQEATKEILVRRGREIILSETEEERAKRIRNMAPDVFICGWSRYSIENFVPDSTLVGMIYHGIGVKPSYWKDNHARLDVRFVEGPYRETQLRANGITTHLELTGYAKLDPLFNGQISDRKSILKQLGLDPGKKTVLYAPTFYPCSFEPLGFQLAENTTDFNLIIKLHAWVYFMDRFGGVDLRPQRLLAEEVERRYGHVRVLTPGFYNIVPLYRASDVLITEASSTVYEMMALDKPVICCRFYNLKWAHRLFPRRLYRHRLNDEMSAGLRKICHPLERPRDLRMVLEKALREDDPFAENRGRYKQAMLYRLDGKASERIRDAILKRI